ncbi:DNA-binding response regulator [Streptomyces sp. NPDC020983]|uniref:DNA-binding response regulator n=1 Tax=Streptomyces sp. NPDC020983 TaxID=3365106 RepID=UPI00379A1BD5
MSHIPHVAVFEHHSLMRRGLESLLSSSPLCHLTAVVAEPGGPGSAGLRVDAVVYGPPDNQLRGLAQGVRRLAAHGRVLVVSDFGGSESVTDVLRAGAYGCVSRQADDDELLRAVVTVARAGVHVDARLAPRLHTELRQSSAAPVSALARRESETLRWIAAGLTHGQIARRMNLTEATVSTYVKRIRSKLNVGNKADLTRKAIELGLLQEEPRPK